MAAPARTVALPLMEGYLILGIMSDSHGDAAATQVAIRVLRNRGASRFVHCGDICGDAVLDQLAEVACDFVWGNCDHPDASTRRYVVALGLKPPDGPLFLRISGKSLAVFHGHEQAFQSLASDVPYHYVLYGHTHRCRDQRLGPCRWINPGALYRARPRTVAALNLETDDLSFFRIDTGEPIALGPDLAM